MNKEQIIDNAPMCSVEEIAEYVQQGIVTMNDLSTNPQFSSTKRKELLQYLTNHTNVSVGNNPVIQEEQDWQNACAENTPESYSRYLAKYENGKYRSDAKFKKSCLEDPFSSRPIEERPDAEPPTIDDSDPWGNLGPDPKEELLRSLSNVHSDNAVFDLLAKHIAQHGKNIFLELFKENNNLISSGVLYLCIQYKLFSISDVGFLDDDFMRAVHDQLSSPVIETPPDNLNIDKLCTEVYFWGISGSGKSCILASLFSVLRSGDFGIWEPSECNARAYMGQLGHLLDRNEVRPLLPGTDLDSTFEMSFDIVKEKQSHPFTFVDIAGGILYLMRDSVIKGRESMDDENNNRLDRITSVFNGRKGENRQIHFFVLEYGAEAKKINGVTQDEFLDNSLDYIKSHGIFSKDTDGIYLIITKADKAKEKGLDVTKEIDRFVEENYKNFYNRLKKLCTENAIDFRTIPYSIGMVKLKSLCKLNPKPAESLLDIIINRSFSNSTTKAGKLKNLFRK